MLFTLRVHMRESSIPLYWMLRMRSDQTSSDLLSWNAGVHAPARSSAGQHRHIKPAKLHQGNKMAIKWQQQYINPSPGSAGGTVKSSWLQLGMISRVYLLTGCSANLQCQRAVRNWAKLKFSFPVDLAHINIILFNKKTKQLYIERGTSFN